MCQSHMFKQVDPTFGGTRDTGKLGREVGLNDDLNLAQKGTDELTRFGDKSDENLDRAGRDIEDFVDPPDPESTTPAARPVRALGIEPEDIELGSGDGDGEVKGKRSLLKKPTGGKSVAKAGLKV